jgi:hypothetical protein
MRGIQYAAASRFKHGGLRNTGSLDQAGRRQFWELFENLNQNATPIVIARSECDEAIQSASAERSWLAMTTEKAW